YSFFSTDPAHSQLSTLSLHDALPIFAYVHMSRLGGFRKTRADSVNLGWRNAGFRGYADYMETPEFARGLEALIELARLHIVRVRSEEHTSELQSRGHLVCRLLLEKKK